MPGPESGDIRIDVQSEAGGDPTGLSHHEHRFRQSLPIPLFQGAQLLNPHVQSSRHLLARHSSGQAGLLKGLTKPLKFRTLCCVQGSDGTNPAVASLRGGSSAL
jgi:hypothetical protein